MKVTIIDYGLSNLLSVQRAVQKLGYEPYVTGLVQDVQEAEVLLLPGVGAFKDGMAGLQRLNLIPVIQAKAVAGTPLLGICLGMQMLFDESTEFGNYKGLGLIAGKVDLIPSADAEGQRQRVPQVGWNALLPPSGSAFSSPLLAATTPGQEVYFVHSYESIPANNENRAADTIYGGRRICAAAGKGLVFGAQFHPEKSGETGLAILNSFLQLAFASLK